MVILIPIPIPIQMRIFMIAGFTGLTIVPLDNVTVQQVPAGAGLTVTNAPVIIMAKTAISKLLVASMAHLVTAQPAMASVRLVKLVIMAKIVRTTQNIVTMVS